VPRSVKTTRSQRDLLLAVIAFLIAFALWQMQGLFFITYPFRLFVTMIHELAHGTAAVLTGGAFVQFEVTRRGAGLAYTRGGWPFVIIQAGYLGTALFGAGLLYLTYHNKRPGRVAIGVGVFIGILTLFFSGTSFAKLSLVEKILAAAVALAGGFLVLTQPTNQGRYVGLGVLGTGGLLALLFAGGGNMLTIVVGLATALILIVIGARASRDVVVVTLTFLAFLTGLQAITDAWVLLRIVSLPHSMMPLNDASAMAHTVGGTAGLWALTWIVLDVLIFGTAVYFTLIKPARRES
jgi:hypothetical protein